MADAAVFALGGKRAVLATMHAKERVIKPLLERALGIRVHVPAGFDTDRFGTFSREVSRAGSQLEAARAKIAAAFEHDRHARVGIASEGSFGPHPAVPFVPLGREIVVLSDREIGLELVGHHADPATNFAHATVADVEEALAFANRVDFPRQGIIVIGVADGGPAPDLLLRKSIETETALSVAVGDAIDRCGAAHIETDMRAHRNPTRMRAIRRAALDVVRCYRSVCPHCTRPGFTITECLYGLPCAWCAEPTNARRADVLACTGCGFTSERPVAATEADPVWCNACNP